MLIQMRFRMLFTLLLSLIVPAGSASADMRFNFENCYNFYRAGVQLALAICGEKNCDSSGLNKTQKKIKEKLR